MTLLLALLLQQPSLPQRQIVAELTIPSSGDGWEFNGVAVVVEGAGGIYVSDWKTPAIQHFDATGKHLARIGRGGAGPGEYQRPINIGVRGDSLWLWEPGQRRLTLWDREGRVGRIVTLVGYEAGYGGLAFLRDGGMATMPGWSSSREGSGRTEEPVRRFGPDGRYDRTLMTIPVDGASLKIETGPEMFIVGDQPFGSLPLLSGSRAGDGFVRVDREVTGPAEFTVIRLDSEGKERWRRTIPYAAGPMDRTIVDSVVRGYTAPADRRMPAVEEGKVRAALIIPPRLIPVLGVLLGSDGKVWLQRPVRAGTPARYTVLSPTGVPQFEVTLPPRGRLASATADALWVVSLDEDDLPIVTRYRVR